MLKLARQIKIWKNFHEGRDPLKERVYMYSLEYLPRPGELPWKITRAKKDGSTSWEEVQPLASGLQCVPPWSCIEPLSVRRVVR